MRTRLQCTNLRQRCSTPTFEGSSRSTKCLPIHTYTTSQHWIRSKIDDMDVKIRVPYLSRNTINGASQEEQGSA